MMLAESNFCQRPPFWTCTRCGTCCDRTAALFSNLRGINMIKKQCSRKLVLQLKHGYEDHVTCIAALPHNSSFSAMPSTTPLVEQFCRKTISASSVSNEQQGHMGPTVDQLDAIITDELQDEDAWSFQSGPFPGDLAEIEAFCRIFRIAEQVHHDVMDALRSVNNSRDRIADNTEFHDDFEKKGIFLSEEKVVSGLGCMGALLHQQKQEVLGGRINLASSFLSRQDPMSPLAHFRSQMKRCCEQLQEALSCYFPTNDMRFAGMYNRFQRLKNVCFDIGHPRTEREPSHADIPNWGAVRLWTLKGDQILEANNEVMFWKGGRVTEEGAQWLVDNGFKAIVDLTAEDSPDCLAKLALNDAVSSRRLRHVKLPIEQGRCPTKDQVLEFANLVADSDSRPFYLQSEVGIGRTSVMVARWRELVHRNASHNSPANRNLYEVNEMESLVQHEGSDLSSDECKTESEMGEKRHGKGIDFVEENGTIATPFEAQRPVANFFLKKAMSKFFKGRQITPPSFRQTRKSMKSARLDSSPQGEESVSLITIEDPAGRWGLDGPGIPRAGKRGDFKMEKGTGYGTFNGSAGVEVRDGMKKDVVTLTTNGASLSVNPQATCANGGLLRFSRVEKVSDESEELVVGDMCASTTGVVRLQSRKKAEMYLVRTDGFSCTREKVKESTLAFTHPSTQQQMLMWKTAPKTVLLLKKLGDELMEEAQQVASFLHYREGMNIIVEPEVHDRFARVPGFGFVQTFYNQDTSDLHEKVDFVVCLGGDGGILHASNLFRNAVPPVVSLNLGSLGFLTAHPFADFMQDLSAIIHGNNRVEGVYITLRMRLRCELFCNGKLVPGKVFDVLNEVVVDRGSNPYLCKIECYERNRLITKVQADGVIVATPTGSTAYSTAAGGSMVHPNVPCMLFTPICPHSLSFRPVILPDSALLELKVPEDARSNAWVSFDGKRRQQLSRGDSVRICMSEHPLPTVNKSDQTDDWFQSLVRCLNWNERLEQKGLTSST